MSALLAELVKEEAEIIRQNDTIIRQNYVGELLQVGIQQEIHNPQLSPECVSGVPGGAFECVHGHNGYQH
jgi:hypothetical protein